MTIRPGRLQLIYKKGKNHFARHYTHNFARSLYSYNRYWHEETAVEGPHSGNVVNVCFAFGNSTWRPMPPAIASAETVVSCRQNVHVIKPICLLLFRLGSVGFKLQPVCETENHPRPPNRPKKAFFATVFRSV